VTTASDRPSAVESQKVKKTTPKPYNTAPGRFHFALRRVHSLAGLVFGGYICVHLLINFTGLWPRAYQQNVDHIHALEPMLGLIEIAAIFTPLLIHALYGIYITWAGVKFNTIKYDYGGNIRYTLQRWTAVILLAFIAFHIGTLHKWGLVGVHNLLDAVHAVPVFPEGHINAGNPDPEKFDTLNRFSAWCSDWGGQFNPHNMAFQTTRQGIRGLFYDPNNPDALGFANTLILGFYLLGILSAVFHFANGLWTSAIAWGLTITATAQKRWGHVCLALGLALAIFGVGAWYAFTFAPWARPLTPQQMQQLDALTITRPDGLH
jgi:succinate dehydrogenase / fumarate reductase, cytochrome b subunit